MWQQIDCDMEKNRSLDTAKWAEDVVTPKHRPGVVRKQILGEIEPSKHLKQKEPDKTRNSDQNETKMISLRTNNFNQR